MRTAALTIAALLVATGVPEAPAQTLFRPVAVVNDTAITGYDLEQRMRLMGALGFRAASESALRDAALQRLVDDRLKLQAGAEVGIRPSPDVTRVGLEALAQRLNQTPAEVEVLLKSQGVDDQAIEDFVNADIIWAEVVRIRFASRVQPGEAEIDSEIALSGGDGETIYRIQEIGIPVGEEQSEAEARAVVDRLAAELTSGGDFVEAVRRYSRAPSRAQDGMVGWVSSRTLPPDLADALARTDVGQVTPPLPVPGGFSILRIDDRRVSRGSQLDPSDPELRQRVRERIVEQQSARLAEGYLQELRRDALIQVR